MAEDGGITISGIDEALAALDALPGKIVNEHLAKALVAAALPVFRAIQSETPRLTGDLAEQLQTTVTLSKDGGKASIGFKRQWAHIARWMEYGFKLTGHKPKKKFIRAITPKSFGFMRRSAETAQAEAVEAFTESLRESLNIN